MKILIVTSDIASKRFYEGNQVLTVRKDAVASLQCTRLHACHFTVVPSGRGSLQTLLTKQKWQLLHGRMISLSYGLFMVYGILQDLLSARRKKQHKNDSRFITTDT